MRVCVCVQLSFLCVFVFAKNFLSVQANAFEQWWAFGLLLKKLILITFGLLSQPGSPLVRSPEPEPQAMSPSRHLPLSLGGHRGPTTGICPQSEWRHMTFGIGVPVTTTETPRVPLTRTVWEPPV